MSETPMTLLGRLQGTPDPADWERFHSLYAPLIQFWLRYFPDLRDEAADIVQEVLLIVVQEITRFERHRDGSFRAWLRAITANKVKSHFKKRNRRPITGMPGGEPGRDLLAELADPNSEICQEWDREHDRCLFERACLIVKADFTAQTWEIFSRYALAGERATEVAQSLHVTEATVFLAKSRVLKRLREEIAGLID